MFENSSSTKVDDAVLARYRVIGNWMSEKKITMPEASLIQYIYTLKKALNDPKKYSKGDNEIEHRELDSCELNLIASFDQDSLNVGALIACKDKHKQLFADFIMKSRKPKKTVYGAKT